jgi:hypothetical protein
MNEVWKDEENAATLVGENQSVASRWVHRSWLVIIEAITARATSIRRLASSTSSIAHTGRSRAAATTIERRSTQGWSSAT